MKPEKLFRCYACGEVITKEEWLKDLESGGTGYCMCDFSAIDEKGEVWYPRILHEYDIYVLQSYTEKVRKEE